MEREEPSHPKKGGYFEENSQWKMNYASQKI